MPARRGDDATIVGRTAATGEDSYVRAAGTNAAGVPRGLEQCPACTEWRGVCLDPSENFAGQLMTVHCRCDNPHRCARCGAALYERRLYANYYDPVENVIWPVPGFCCVNPRCSAGGR